MTELSVAADNIALVDLVHLGLRAVLVPAHVAGASAIGREAP